MKSHIHWSSHGKFATMGIKWVSWKVNCTLYWCPCSFCVKLENSTVDEIFYFVVIVGIWLLSIQWIIEVASLKHQSGLFIPIWYQLFLYKLTNGFLVLPSVDRTENSGSQVWAYIYLSLPSFSHCTSLNLHSVFLCSFPVLYLSSLHSMVVLQKIGVHFSKG